MHEVWLIEEARTELAKVGLQVFSPFHDVGTKLEPGEIAVRDLAGLEQADFVFALLDGLDAGTVFEVGHAHRAGKPVVAYVQKANPGDLTMMIGTGMQIESDFATAIYKAAWMGLSLT